MKKIFIKYLICTPLIFSASFNQPAFGGNPPDLIFASDFEGTPCQAIPLIRDFVVDEFEDSSGLLWGQATGVSNIFALTKNQYSAQSFDAPVGALTKRVIFENGRPSEGGIASYTATISTCPGDFTTHLNQDFCKVTGQTPTLRWTTDPNTANFRCLLQEGATYYLNIVHSVDEASDYTVSDCGGQFATCGVLFAEIF